jgi:hypothetical protein
VPWEDFRAGIEAVTETKPEQRKSNAGRKPYDTILKLKIVMLQSLQRADLIRDRISFMRFLDLNSRTRCRMPPRSGCFARRWRRPG